jgi:hypothetical protein
MNKIINCFRNLNEPTRTRHMEQNVLICLKEYNKSQDKREAMDQICGMIKNEIRAAEEEIINLKCSAEMLRLGLNDCSKENKKLEKKIGEKNE